MFRTSLICSAFKIQGFVFESCYQLRSSIPGLLFGYFLCSPTAKFLICIVNYFHNLFEMVIFSMQLTGFPQKHCFVFYHIVPPLSLTLGSEQWCSMEGINFPSFLFFHFLQSSRNICTSRSVFPPTL